MAVLKPRKLMISVRLSEEEYSTLRRLCLLTGARSVSDLTRDAMRGLLGGVTREDFVSNHMDEFRAEILHSHRKVEHVAAVVESIRGRSARL